jgi:hypothetical protein
MATMVASFTNKDNIFDYIKSEDIFLKFLNLPELPKGNISSPFSEDKKASFRVYRNGTFKCFSTGKQGDAIQFVADLYNLDCKTQFIEVAKIISTECKLHMQNTANFLQNTQKRDHATNNTLTNTYDFIPKFDKGVLQNMEQKTFTISVVNREMGKFDFAFWNSLGVDEQLLSRFGVGAVENFTFYSENKSKDVLWEVKNYLAFSYNVNGRYEVYIPNQPEKRRSKFFCNGLGNDDIFGLAQLQNTKNDILIICAGKKDALVSCSRGFPAVSFRSENHLPTREQITVLQNHCKKLFICYDNDNGGRSGKEKILSQFKNIISIELPDEINDLTDYFQINMSSDFQKLLDAAIGTDLPKKDDAAENNEVWTIFHIAEKYLAEHYDIRFNVISNEIEISPKETDRWKVLNENSIFRELQKKSIKIPKLSLVAILMSDFVPEYHPLKDYFANLGRWDQETDYIKQFADYVTLANTENRDHFVEQFKKWCVRVVRCAIDPAFFNKEAFIITDNGLTNFVGEIKQSMGKTSWCRFLCPPKLSKYIGQNVSSIEKDALSSLCNNLLINLDELDNMGKFSLNKLKSLFSLDSVKLRLPYDKRDSVFPRVASFIGSTNEANFLYDETGSARWICFVVEGINWKYREEFDINNLWSQAVYLLKDEKFIHTISKDELRINESRNDKFQIVSPERDLINRLFALPKSIEEAEFLSATDIVEHIHLWSAGIKINPVAVGKALKKAGYNRSRLNQQWGYYICKNQR